MNVIDSKMPSAQINWEHLHHISDNNAEFEVELLQLFVEDSGTQIEYLKEAIAHQDFVNMERTAHHIKGASANVGAIVMQAASEYLEQLARQQQLMNVEPLLAELEQALVQIKALLPHQ